MRRQKDKKLRIPTLIWKAIQGHFDTFKPVEIILKGVEWYTGIKEIHDSFVREMVKEVHLSEENKRFKNVLFTVHRGILTAMTAIAPIANRMMAQNKFSLLSDDMNRGLVFLATTSNFLNYRRFENVFKLVTTDAGKEVARSKKVTDNTGKDSMLFLAPEPIKGKPLDKTKMFVGQLPYLFKLVSVGNTPANPRRGRRVPNRKPDFSSGGPDIGATGTAHPFNPGDELNASRSGGTKGTIPAAPTPAGRSRGATPSRC